jgi:hypothetical protein
MKREWHPDELMEHWTMLPQEHKLLGNKSGPTRLGFAVLLTLQRHLTHGL